MNRREQNASYLFAVVAYIVLAAGFTTLIYLDQKSTYDRWINRLLIQGVESMSAVLPEQLHMQAMDGHPLNYQAEKDLAFVLGELAQSHELSYLYTLVLAEDGKARFVISSPTPEEMQGAEYETAYLTTYEELDADLRPYFSSNADHYLEYSDRWGNFRSIFRVVQTSDGRPYLLAADIDISEVNQALQSSILKTVVMLILLFIVSMPLLVLIHCSRQKELKNKIQTLLIDPMTRLRNRVALSQDIKRMHHPQLMVLDILRFSDVNNAYGPARSDQVLSHFAKHLSRFSHPALQPHQTYRLHGDEFAILVDQESMPDDLDSVFREFLKYISAFEYKVSYDEFISLKVVAGIALNRHTDFITSAKIALQSAREQGLSLVRFSDNLPQASRFQENLTQLELLQRAIEEKRLVPWFQPIFESESLSVISYEALARIVDDKGNIQSMPDDFLPVAHRYQIYYKVTREIVRQTIEWLQGNNCNASINLSIRDVEHRGTREYILRMIRETGMGPRLSFELLESEAINDLGLTLKFFGELAKQGCRLGIDDLGKEYSNFDRLMVLPLNFIKLDGAVLHHLGGNDQAFSVVEKIVALAHRKNLKVTAEVVSSEDLLNLARRLGCNHVQGYHVGPPSQGMFSPG